MVTAKSKAFVDEAESLLAAIRGSVLVHVQDGVNPTHLKTPLESARALNSIAARIGDSAVAEAADALDAWLALLASESEQISHTRTRSLLDQISELEVALIAYRAVSHAGALDVTDFVDESFDSLQALRSDDAVEDETPAVEDDFEIDAEMLEVFREEAATLLQHIHRNLDRLLDHPNDRDALWEIKKNAHTFKGAAGIVGLRKSSELAHRIEDLLERVSEKDADSNFEILTLLINAANCLKSLADGESSAELDARIAALYLKFGDTVRAISSEPEIDESAAITVGRSTITVSRPTPATEPSADSSKPARNSTIVRVSLDRLDELVKNIHELVVSRIIFEQHIGELDQQLEESSNNTLRLKSASRKIENFELFPPETSQATPEERRVEFRQNAYELTETAKDSSVIDSALGGVKKHLESLYTHQRGLIHAIQERLMRLRNVEFGTVATRLQRTVRVTCDEEGKHADVIIENGSLEVDTQVIDSLIEPLMHLLKNAVVHGIEPAETRRLLGKPESGKITIRVANEGAHVLMTVSDDGAGISFTSLLEKAVASGMIAPDAAERMTREEICDLVFLPGLTTAEKLTLNAGRGVGMSIVRESVEAARGTVSMETYPQKGTTFSLRVPLPFPEAKVNAGGTISSAALHPTELSVLIVDDSPSVRLMTSRMIQNAGMRAQTAKNGIDALEKLIAMQPAPNVILSDVEMPKMGGYEFLAALKRDEQLKSVPVVFITSRTGEENRSRALTAGAAEYLTKPYDERVLVKLVERLALGDKTVVVE